MPPKRPPRARRTKESAKAVISPQEKPLTSSSSGEALGGSGNEVKRTNKTPVARVARPLSSPSVRAVSEKAPSPTGFGPCHVIGVLLAVVLTCVWSIFPPWDATDAPPCHCFPAGGEVQQAIASRMFGVTGIHLRGAGHSAVEESLRGLSSCGKLYTLENQFDGVGSFMQRLQHDAKGTRCVVWLVKDLSVVKHVDNALKELLEDNTLRGNRVLPDGARGLFIVLSNQSREEIKGSLPHRVVHQFRTINLPAKK
ncbi:hypothetical protein DPX39_040057000 [Trypanosoma brucei equiperdum]|uniref:Uncharacterized protein n=1 Tax=Trypanosoma brucei equiperdum TaxID=630700 RepID=A0A3L6L953_9TRYP|nr:hypothetical protein DPX39_040057000 [Trypanosoma brucei equiperdum]